MVGEDSGSIFLESWSGGDSAFCWPDPLSFAVEESGILLGPLGESSPNQIH